MILETNDIISLDDLSDSRSKVTDIIMLSEEELKDIKTTFKKHGITFDNRFDSIILCKPVRRT